MRRKNRDMNRGVKCGEVNGDRDMKCRNCLRRGERNRDLNWREVRRRELYRNVVRHCESKRETETYRWAELNEALGWSVK